MELRKSYARGTPPFQSNDLHSQAALSPHHKPPEPFPPTPTPPAQLPGGLVAPEPNIGSFVGFACGASGRVTDRTLCLGLWYDSAGRDSGPRPAPDLALRGRICEPEAGKGVLELAALHEVASEPGLPHSR